MNIKNRAIRIGVVGCGKIAAQHFNAIQNLSNQFELVSICDTQETMLQQTATQFNVAGYAQLDAMLNAHPDLDVVTLCSPSGLHAEQTIHIAKQKKHIITEKPMATRWTDGIEMVKACDKANVNLFVVKQIRYQPTLRLLKEAILKNRFGRLYLANLNVFWTRPQSYYDQAKWRGTWEFDGGAFMNQASHYVDLLDWLFGPVQTVQAMMATLAIQMEAEDTGVLNIRWRSGMLGAMSCTMLTYPKNLEASLTVLGEKGSVKIGGTSANQIDHWAFDTPDETQDTLAEQLKNPDHTNTSSTGHTHYYENVAKTLRGEAPADIDGRAGLRSLEILTAAYLSARDHQTIHLPLMF
ncbi:MAG: Gfo/Idh/MocA family oxidoreductase [Gammaproteobacteria bacterium]|nr:Gfo/Idh/MocA family oxidoreductase [Gammaproteobacteria bacterium]